MSDENPKWECGVCGYTHTGAELPEKCPVCDAPQKMFKKVEPVAEEVKEEKKTAASQSKAVKQWRCKVSGYLHTGPEPPQKCPICEATAADFEEVGEEEKIVPVLRGEEKRWRCSVCGYIHKGESPPEKCPICAAPSSMFVEIDSQDNALGKAEQEGVEADGLGSYSVGVAPETIFAKLARVVLKFHLHPIHAHFPNGILPAALIFLVIAYFYNMALLADVAFCNLIFVLVTLPVVLLTGFMEWKARYGGAKTGLFVTKIICALVVLVTVSTLVVWRVVEPGVYAQESPVRSIYLGIAVVMLLATALAGHLGGKLVHGSRH